MTDTHFADDSRLITCNTAGVDGEFNLTVRFITPILTHLTQAEIPGGSVTSKGRKFDIDFFPFCREDSQSENQDAGSSEHGAKIKVRGVKSERSLF